MNNDVGVWTVVATCPRLRVLAVEGVNCRVPKEAAAHLSVLRKVSDDHSVLSVTEGAAATSLPPLERCCWGEIWGEDGRGQQRKRWMALAAWRSLLVCCVALVRRCCAAGEPDHHL